jgi:hypothetical protein
VLVYEVNLAVDAEVAEAFAAWLPGHVAELLALPGFLAAEIFRVEEPAPPAGEVALSVRYRLRDRAALDAYLRDHAARLRADGIARFGGRFQATRRVLSATGPTSPAM